MAFASIWNTAKRAKVGDTCTVAWCFDCQTALNISTGTVKTVRSRGGSGKVTLDYKVIKGHNVGASFTGFLPPQPNVRVFLVLWDRDLNEDIGRNHEEDHAAPVHEHTETDLDLDPIPTQRTISPEFVPCVVAIFRDMMRDYKDISYGPNIIYSKGNIEIVRKMGLCCYRNLR